MPPPKLIITPSKIAPAITMSSTFCNRVEPESVPVMRVVIRNDAMTKMIRPIKSFLNPPTATLLHYP